MCWSNDAKHRDMTDSDRSEADRWPPRLTVDTARVLALLTGDRFYSSKDAALREAVLNAIDACTRRSAAEPSAIPAITVEFDDTGVRVLVADNGDGMSRAEVSSLFTRIGASMANLLIDVESVGEFGIGVISYFLVCDAFELHSARPGHDPVGLLFSAAMLDSSTPATEIAPARSNPGMTLVLQIRDQPTYDLLVDRFPHWCRGVEHLTATRAPSGQHLRQGQSVQPAATVEVELPDWAEATHLGPPTGFDRWSLLDGRAVVDILYRGVFVETQTVNGLWGMEGTISVHPKRLKPRLNREGFLAEDLQRDVQPFLQAIHPVVLHAGLASLLAALDDPAASAWSVQRIVALWLAVPRHAPYEGVVAEWDSIFRSRKLFRRLEVQGDRDVSLDELVGLGRRAYLAPENLRGSGDLVQAAVRILRARGETVVQGISRDTGFLSLASFVAQSTADLLLNYFVGQLPELIRVEQIAQQVVTDTVRVAELFPSDPKVALVRLGEDGAPLIHASGELWINLDTPAGRAIVQGICSENGGRNSLLVFSHLHAEQHVNLLSEFVRAPRNDLDRLGLVTRQYLRGLSE
jgi:hypothetical protein